MLEAMSCWKVDWPAIGAVMTGFGAVATAITAAIALRVGLEPRRLKERKAHVLAGVAASVLAREVLVLLRVGERMAGKGYNPDELLSEAGRSQTIELLQCPLLKDYLERASDYPEELAYDMGDLYGVAATMQLRVIAFGKMGVDEDDVKKIQSLASLLEQCARRLVLQLNSYTPVRNRSVSNTPSDTPAGLPQK